MRRYFRAARAVGVGIALALTGGSTAWAQSPSSDALGLADEVVASSQDPIELAHYIIPSGRGIDAGSIAALRQHAARSQEAAAHEALALALLTQGAQARAEAVAILQRLSREAPASQRQPAHVTLAFALAITGQEQPALAALDQAFGSNTVSPLRAQLRALLLISLDRTRAPAVLRALDGQGLSLPYGPPTPNDDTWRGANTAMQLAMRSGIQGVWGDGGYAGMEHAAVNGARMQFATASIMSGPAAPETLQRLDVVITQYEIRWRPTEGLQYLDEFLAWANGRVTGAQLEHLLIRRARLLFASGRSAEAASEVARTRALLAQRIPSWTRERIQAEYAVAQALAQPQTAALGAEAFRNLDRDLVAHAPSPERDIYRVEAAIRLLPLLGRIGDVRAVESTYASSSQIARNLGSLPPWVGTRLQQRHLDIGVLEALIEYPERYEEAEARLVALITELDSQVGLYSGPIDDAIGVYRRAFNQFDRDSDETYYARGNAVVILTRAIPALARVRFNQGKWAQAAADLERALVLDFAANTVCGSDAQIEFTHALAVAEKQRGDAERATHWSNEALSCVAAVNRTSLSYARSIRQRGTILAAGPQRNALGQTQDSLDGEIALRRSIDVLATLSTGGDWDLGGARMDLANLLSSQSRPTAAASLARAGANELVRAAGRGQASAVQSSELSAALTILATLESRSPGTLHDEAFRLMQMANASDAANSIRAFSERAAESDPAIAQLLQRRVELDRRRARLDRDFRRLFGSGVTTDNERQRAQLLQQISQVDGDLSAANRDLRSIPSYAGFAMREPLTLSAAKAALRDGEVLLTFVQTPDAIFGLAISQSGSQFARLGLSPDQLHSAVTSLRRALDLSTVRSLDALPTFDLTAAHQLYRAAVLPFEPTIGGARRLVVVLDGDLQSIPLEALPTRPATDYASASWFGARVAISVLPSVDSLSTLRRATRPTTARNPLLVFADPALGQPRDVQTMQLPSDPRELLLQDGGAAADVCLLAPLPQTRDLANAMRTALGGGDILLGPEATITRLAAMNTTGQLANARILAFATHGLIAGELPRYSDIEPALVLSPDPPCGQIDDSLRQTDALLTVSEIASLRLDAEWVLLVACNTAAPDGSPGAEPLSGLASAFLFAGARALLVSHWPAEATATRLLLENMFAPEASALSRTERLQRAQAALRATPGYEHPALWAVFFVVGADT